MTRPLRRCCPGQAERQLYDVADLGRWKQGGSARGLVVTADNLPLFLQKVRGLSISTPVKQSVANLTDLNALLELVLRAGPEYKCVPGGRLLVTGQTVVLDQAVSRYGCSHGVRSVEVYALNTIVVNSDVALPGGSLVVAAPRWYVRGDRKISVDGQAGQPWGSRPGEAADGQPGKEGRRGRPGAPGGSFLGVGAVFQGGFLTVNANGGQGGSGERGGDGGPGRPGGGHGGGGGRGGAGGVGGAAGLAQFISTHRPEPHRHCLYNREMFQELSNI